MPALFKLRGVTALTASHAIDAVVVQRQRVQHEYAGEKTTTLSAVDDHAALVPRQRQLREHAEQHDQAQ